MGCTHAVLSVDLNYVGVIIGDDIDISEDGKLLSLIHILAEFSVPVDRLSWRGNPAKIFAAPDMVRSGR